MNYEYWLDVNDYFEDGFKRGISLDTWTLIYFQIFGKQITFPNLRFWAITLLSIGMGVKIYDTINGYWTIEGCFQEIEEILEG